MKKQLRSMEKPDKTVDKVHVIFSTMILCFLLFPSCSILEKASSHGFERGNYTMKQAGISNKSVYIESSENEIRVYERNKDGVQLNSCLFIPQGIQDSVCHIPATFSKQSLDIDITSVLFKVRPPGAEFHCSLQQILMPPFTRVGGMILTVSEVKVLLWANAIIG
ncbi:MAG: hypothetical protein IPO92_17245 [Saprospiraceae bacterium]|nr:hypothetical protein [Saprospiraceae bacterium]